MQTLFLSSVAWSGGGMVTSQFLQDVTRHVTPRQFTALSRAYILYIDSLSIHGLEASYFLPQIQIDISRCPEYQMALNFADIISDSPSTWL